MKSQHIEQLAQWLREPITDTSPHQLRTILGELLKSVNAASHVFKKSSRASSPQNAIEAQKIIADIVNYESFQKMRPQLEEKVKQLKGLKTFSLLNILHTLEHARFNPQQVMELRQIAGGQEQTTSQDFPEEMNKEGLENLLRTSIYNLKDQSDKTLKVIREVLQNAVDATDPQQHPNLSRRHNFKPEIHLNSHEYKDYMDIVVYDKGIGMNWDILSKKFFVTFDSGKGADTGAAGGFGIAKALIQDAPEHGWSIDTNAVHSSRFHKNVYFGSRQGAGYQPPVSKVQSNPEGGTMLSLYGLPVVPEYKLRDLCEVYATNGRVAIFLNEESVKPRFTLSAADVTSDISNLPDLISTNETEKEIASSVFAKVKGELESKIHDVSQYAGAQTQVKFFYRKSQKYTSGKLYVMVNGQYQFDRTEYIDKLDVICSIQTSARPGSDAYPLDPGRGMVRGEIGEEINQVVAAIKEFTSKTAEDDLFKQGIDAIMANEDAPPMSTIEDDDNIKQKKNQLAAVLRAEIEETMHAPPQEQIEKVVQVVADATGGPITPMMHSIIATLMAGASAEENARVKQQRIKAIIDGLTTPANIMIQKNFIARQEINNRLELIAEMTILWQKTLKALITKLAESSRFNRITSKKFIPGMIFSDEALGLYMPPSPESGRPYPSVSINPITLAAAINPKAFNDKLGIKSSEEAFKEIPGEEEKVSGDTPINRVAKFLFHIGLHELCHLLYPDSYSAENFHRNITKMEILCHDAYEDIRLETKKYMKQLRSKSSQLMTIIAKHKKRDVQESMLWKSLAHTERSSRVLAAAYGIILESLCRAKFKLRE